MLIFDVPEVKLLLIIVAEMMLYLKKQRYIYSLI